MEVEAARAKTALDAERSAKILEARAKEQAETAISIGRTPPARNLACVILAQNSDMKRLSQHNQKLTDSLHTANGEIDALKADKAELETQ